MTGWPPGLLQDDDRGLSRWLANRPGARRLVRIRCDEIRNTEMTDYAEYKRLSAQQRDELGFARWQELQAKLKHATQIADVMNLGLSGQAPDGRDQDALYAEAVEVVRNHQKASISLVQRHLKISYFRAAGLLETMEKFGLISAPDAEGRRTLLPALTEEGTNP